SMPAMPAVLPPLATLSAARLASFRALCASTHISNAKKPRTATRMPSIIATIAATACEPGSGSPRAVVGGEAEVVVGGVSLFASLHEGTQQRVRTASAHRT